MNNRFINPFPTSKFKPVSINRIINDKRIANTDELINLYHQYVCASTPYDTINKIKQKELKRLIAIGIYQKNKVDGERVSSRVIEKITGVLGIGQSTFYLYWTERLKK